MRRLVISSSSSTLKSANSKRLGKRDSSPGLVSSSSFIGSLYPQSTTAMSRRLSSASRFMSSCTMIFPGSFSFFPFRRYASSIIRTPPCAISTTCFIALSSSPQSVPMKVPRSHTTTCPFESAPASCSSEPNILQTVVLPVPGLPRNRLCSETRCCFSSGNCSCSMRL